jgi:hypothetical protein
MQAPSINRRKPAPNSSLSVYLDLSKPPNRGLASGDPNRHPPETCTHAGMPAFRNLRKLRKERVDWSCCIALEHTDSAFALR